MGADDRRRRRGRRRGAHRHSLDQRRSVAELVREADAIENADPDYRAELQQWTTAHEQPRRRCEPPAPSPKPPPTTARVPLRDFGNELCQARCRR